MGDIAIVNVVGTARLGRRFDLNHIALSLEGAEYYPERFAGLICRIDRPKATFLIFKSGKVVCTGTTSIRMAQKAVNSIVERLTKIDVDVERKPKLNIVNIVATSDLGVQLDLNKVVFELGIENIEYEPEQFPGMVYRVYEPKVVILLFSTGRIVCTGARNLEDLSDAVDQLKEDLEDMYVL